MFREYVVRPRMSLLRMMCALISYQLSDFSFYFYRAMHNSAKRGIAIACRPSVCLSVRLSVCL